MKPRKEKKNVVTGKSPNPDSQTMTKTSPKVISPQKPEKYQILLEQEA